MIKKICGNTRGFTLFEMLITVLITISLLGVAAVSAVHYISVLKITELDNAAKQIFLAAQNEALLLKGNQSLNSLIVKTGESNKVENVDVSPGSLETTQITVYYIHSDDENIDKILPENSIDPSLWEGDFYITYEAESASVVDVFFSKETIDINGDFASFNLWREKSKDERRKNNPMIGHYGGESAESGTSTSLRTPVINIYNEDELIVDVTYWVPKAFEITGDDANIDLDVQFEYQDITDTVQSIDLNGAFGEEITSEAGILFTTYTYRWILDSLEEGKQFKDVFKDYSDIIYGNDFSIVAEVVYSGSNNVNGAKKIASDNTLFAKDSGGETAYIANTRHLQNLSADFSSVSENKKYAVQIKDIKSVKDYDFKPVNNDNLVSYDGGNYKISELNIESVSGYIGLFGEMSGTNSNHKQLKNINLVNTSVKSQVQYTGVLLGKGSNTDILNCGVFWENTDETSDNLRKILGDSDNGINYKVTAERGFIGGLAGALENSKVENSFSASVLSGETVGGLIGYAENTNIQKSYVASYINGKNIGGMIGSSAGNINITDSYTTGFVQGKQNSSAAGFVLGQNISLNRSYSSLLYTDSSVNYPLCISGSYANTYYLNSDLFASSDDKALEYDEITNETLWKTLFGENSNFERKTVSQTNAYNLQTTLTLTAYSFPGIKDINHNGDWGAKFQNGSLVYYEVYSQDGKDCQFSGGGLNLLKNQQPLTDGYAIAYRGNENIASTGCEVEISYVNDDGNTVTKIIDYSPSDMHKVIYNDPKTGNEEYYVLPLPNEIVNTKYTSQNFYHKISFKETSDKNSQMSDFYYNPHFAECIIPFDENLNLSEYVNQLRVKIRTPRHMYMLSQYSSYYSSYNQYSFIQELNLDYGIYTGYNLFNSDTNRQNPIGLNETIPMRSNYYGNHKTISNILPNTSAGLYVGLFGYNIGVIQDVVYLADGNEKLSFNHTGSNSGILYAGGLLGYNGGSVYNCAVSGINFELYSYDYSTSYLGGFAGRNQGSISNCSADVSQISVQSTLSNSYTGGFVGENISGVIQKSYSVGYIKASRSRYGDVYACGFAGKNSGNINKSYAAVGISVSDGAVLNGFSNGESSQCVYLNAGNFTYNNLNYTAQYSDKNAVPVKWENFAQSDGTDIEEVASLEMMRNVSSFNNPNEQYPYPGSVTDENGKPIHYGKWPDIMNLGVVGVYYWEKMEIGQTTSYYFSAITVDMNSKNVTYNSTLSNAHGDGGIITEYGYGYFHSDKQPDVNVTNLGYGSNTVFVPNAGLENTQANTELQNLMSNKYTFHSFNSWQAGKNTGMYITGSSANNAPQAGKWTLKTDSSSVVFEINPFFADSMRFVSAGYNVDENVPQETIGLQNNPFDVRSIEQLQFINWNVNAKNNIRPVDEYNYINFMFLTTYENGRKFYWEQTHDIDGSNIDDYVPIAAIRDEVTAADTTGEAYAWFGGSYNGNDYTIKELSITNNAAYSTTGLFGFTYNANIENIVMYSPSGTAKIEAANSTLIWYAMGGLVGLAANGKDTDGAIKNCSVSGYTIIDSNPYCAYGGGGVGGIVGICNMALKECTAVTDIVLNFKHSDSSRNVRVGGLAGSCQQSIEKCYSGGTITLGSYLAQNHTSSNIHVGGLVGGYFMKVLYLDPNNKAHSIESGVSNNMVPQDKITEFKNSYSYIKLDKSVVQKANSVYAIGGLGEISRSGGNNFLADYENCYYLDTNMTSVSGKPVIDESKVNKCHYSDLSLDGKAYNALIDAGFSTVTTKTFDGKPIDGRYSFGISEKLLGTNYPFPTILKQESEFVKNEDGSNGKADIHYGDWPVKGIERAYGALPVSIDIFSKNPVWQETVWLSNLDSSELQTGGWTVESLDETVVSANISENSSDISRADITITPQSQGNTSVVVSYTDKNKVKYTNTIEVNVSVDLQVSFDVDPLLMFTDETVTAAVTLKNSDGEKIPDDMLQDVSVEIEYDLQYIKSANVTNDNNVLTAEIESLSKEGQTRVTAVCSYTYNSKQYTSTNPLTVQIEKREIELKGLTVQTQGQDTVVVEYKNAEFTQELQGAANIAVIGCEEIEDYNQYLYPIWNSGGYIEIEVYNNSQLETNVAAVNVQIQFEYGGTVHKMWKILPVTIISVTDTGTSDEEDGKVVEDDIQNDDIQNTDESLIQQESTNTGITAEN